MLTFLCPPTAPLGSVSSMEVNVDMLDQLELTDISDQEALDVFFSSGGEEGVLMSPLPGTRTRTKKKRLKHRSCVSDPVFLFVPYSARKQQQRGGHWLWTFSTCPWESWCKIANVLHVVQLFLWQPDLQCQWEKHPCGWIRWWRNASQHRAEERGTYRETLESKSKL